MPFLSHYEKCWIIPVKLILKIRAFASSIGTLTSSFPENQFCLLHHRVMLKLKDKSLKYNKGNFIAVIKFEDNFTSPEVICENKS